MTTITGTNGSDSLTGTSGDDMIFGLDGNDTISGGAGNNQLYGGNGDDKLFGGGDNDYLDGGIGNDTLTGGSGDDTYFYASGYGHDTITDPNGSGVTNDTLLLGPGITLADISFTRDAGHLDDMTIHLDSNDDIKITNQFSTSFSAYAIETLKFDDGSTYDLTSTAHQYTTYGTSGNDTISGIGANGSPDDIIYGFAGNDAINGGIGNDYLDGGIGNDTLKGGAGDDTYYYASGYGHDIIADPDGSSVTNDTILLGPGITLADISFTRDAGHLDDLTIHLDVNNDLKITNEFSTSFPAYTIETLKFDDGSTYDLTSTAHQYTTYGTSGNDTISGIAVNGSPDDIIYGFDGNDTFLAGAGNDYLDGGIGNDTLKGGAGDDTYFFATGYGHDIINEPDGTSGGNDTILLGPGITLADISFTRDAGHLDDLTIHLDVNNDLKITNEFSASFPTYNVETLKFDDGSTIDLTTHQYTTYGTSGNDTISGIAVNGSPDDIIFGMAGNDTINGGAGNDYIDGGIGNDSITGGVGNDTYFYAGVGSGHDIFNESSGNSSGDVVLLGPGITAGDISMYRDLSNNLMISLNTNDDMKLSGHFSSAANTFETLKFDDGSTIDLTTHQYETHGTSGNDTISGITLNGSPDDIILGMAGNDTINGGAGNDTLYGGDGLDTLTGGLGADNFVFEAASAFNNIDTVQDFSTAQNDAINVADLLIGYTPGTSNITDFVSLSVSGSNTTLSVDRDGSGGAYSSQAVATLHGVTGLDVATMLADHHLIAST